MELISLTNNGLGVTLVCTSSTGATRVLVPGDGDLVVTNVGTCTGYLGVGGSTGFTAVAPGATGSAASYPILVGTKEDQITIPPSEAYAKEPYVAGVCAAGETTTLIVHRVRR